VLVRRAQLLASENRADVRQVDLMAAYRSLEATLYALLSDPALNRTSAQGCPLEQSLASQRRVAGCIGRDPSY
jgi:hypothetical protein